MRQPRGESRHCILKGDFALYDFIPATLALAEAPIDEMLVATLSMSKKNAEDLGELVRAGQVKSLAILVSHYFSASEKEIYVQTVEVCRAIRADASQQREVTREGHHGCDQREIEDRDDIMQRPVEDEGVAAKGSVDRHRRAAIKHGVAADCEDRNFALIQSR